MIHVALLDDHPLILKIVSQELARDLDLQILWQSTDISQLFTLLNEAVPDVLVLDLAFSGQGFEPVSTIQDLQARFPTLQVLILTAQTDPIWIEELLKAGAKGYVVKSDDFSLRLAEAIRTVAQGRTFLSSTAATGLTQAHQKYTLTNRERAILRLASEGHANPEIADLLGVASGTIRNHLSNIYAKLGVDNREAAIREARNLRELPNADANLRHELRTPLHTLLGLARLLQTRMARHGQLSPEKDQDYLDQIVVEAQRLDRMLDHWND